MTNPASVHSSISYYQSITVGDGPNKEHQVLAVAEDGTTIVILRPETRAAADSAAKAFQVALEAFEKCITEPHAVEFSKKVATLAAETSGQMLETLSLIAAGSPSARH